MQACMHYAFLTLHNVLLILHWFLVFFYNDLVIGVDYHIYEML